MRLVLIVVAAFFASATALEAGGRRVDLATAELDGKPILRGSIADVTAALGKPDFRSFTIAQTACLQGL
jgi:hypothetical protein